MNALRLSLILTLAWVSAAHAETLTCSTSFQGYRVCQGPDGYRSIESEWRGSRSARTIAGMVGPRRPGTGSRRSRVCFSHQQPTPGRGRLTVRAARTGAAPTPSNTSPARRPSRRTSSAEAMIYDLIILVTTAGAHPTAFGYTYGCGPDGQPFWQQCNSNGYCFGRAGDPAQAGASPSGSSRPMTTIAAIDPCRAEWTRVSRPQARFPGRNAA